MSESAKPYEIVMAEARREYLAWQQQLAAQPRHPIKRTPKGSAPTAKRRPRD